ncbi:DnaA N-terminal domain-containing protein, partial [Falsihalocynthiibacter arcticus]|uniref:DnaA N-terminal domain-containing protein n=2 Tax=Falsihalocynthiibacter TaxID=2854182 RepID=UPI00300396C5
MTNETWGTVRNELQKTVGQSNFTNWIEPLEFSSLKDGIAVFAVPTSFMGNWVSRNFGDQIKHLLNEAGAAVSRLEFAVASKPVARPASKAQKA